MVELFVGFITRPATPSENSDNSLSSKSSPTSLLTDFIDEDVLREREVVNEIESGDEAKFKEARRAFNATIVLCDGAGSAQSLLDRTFTRTGKQISKGPLFFKKIIFIRTF